MGYQTVIVCDQCRKENQVPQPGSTPTGWVVMRVLAQGATQPTTHSFCSWICCAQFAAQQAAQEQVKVAAATQPQPIPQPVKAPWANN